MFNIYQIVVQNKYKFLLFQISGNLGQFIELSFPSEEVMGPNFWRKFFFLPWLIRMFPQHWRTFKYTLMIAVNVVLQVRTQWCIFTGICPVKITTAYLKFDVPNYIVLHCDKNVSKKITIYLDDCCFSTTTHWNVLTGTCLGRKISIVDDCCKCYSTSTYTMMRFDKNISGKESTIIVDIMDLIQVHNGLFDRTCLKSVTTLPEDGFKPTANAGNFISHQYFAQKRRFKGCFF